MTDGSDLQRLASTALTRVKAIDGLLEQVRGALASPLRDEVPLEVLEERLRRAVERLVGGDACESEVEALGAAVRRHPEYAARVEREEREWDARQAPENRRAFLAQRAVIPADVATLSAKDLDARVPRLAKRLRMTRFPWVVWVPEEALRRAHPADLRHKYNPSNCDVVELRAAYHTVRDLDFENDADGLKDAWRAMLRQKLKDMLAREQHLKPHELRRPEYARDVEKRGDALRPLNRLHTTSSKNNSCLFDAIRARRRPD